MSIKDLINKKDEKDKEDEYKEDPDWKTMESQSKKITKSPICPICGSDMRKINGNFGPFWGCSKYGETKCTGKISIYSKGKNIIKKKTEIITDKILTDKKDKKEIGYRYVCDLLIGKIDVPEEIVESLWEWLRDILEIEREIERYPEQIEEDDPEKPF